MAVPSAFFVTSLLMFSQLLLTVHATSLNPRETSPQFNRSGFRVENFGWSSCSDEKNPLAKIDSISLFPDPVDIPGDVSLHFAGVLNRPITPGTTPLHLRIYKKVTFFWVEVPCNGEDSIGSCDYEDFCKKWPLPGPDCPETYKNNGIPCKCPFAAGKYNLPQSVVGHVKETSLPKWLERGDYRIKAWLSEPDNEYALCFELKLKIHPL